MTVPPLLGMPEVELTIAGVRVIGRELRIGYALANRGDAEIFAQILLPDRYAQLGANPGRTPIASLAQTCLRPPSTAVLRLGQTPAPALGPGFSFYAIPRPDAIRIEAGQGFAATIRAPLPLVEWSETWMPMRDDAANVEVEITRVRVEIECIRAADVTRARELEHAPGCWEIASTCTELLVHELDVEALGLRLLAHPDMTRFGGEAVRGG